MKNPPRKQEELIPIDHQREMSQMYLTTFSQSYYDLNFLDDSINKWIDQLLSEKEVIEKKLHDLKKNTSLDEEMYFEISSDLSEKTYEIHLRMAPLSEVQIIYAYKDFEVKFVQLLKSAYPKDALKGSFRWTT